MVRRVLMIASHYPPMKGSSGLQRTLKFSRYLLDHGWEPIVLTVHPRAHPKTSDDQMTEIPPQVTVRRSFALDAARHLSIRGMYPRFLGWPDRWVSWWFGAVPDGLALIRKFKPQVIWSTYPIATANLVGLTLHRMTGIPWVADLRDSMTEDEYPPDPATRNIYRWIERHTVSRAARVVFTTAGTQRMYADRYPDVPGARWACIPNGYDEENFQMAEQCVRLKEKPRSHVELIHSGLIYQAERDPRAFFAALRELRDSGEISAAIVKVKLRASGSEDIYGRMIKDCGVDDIVSLEPAIAYMDALAEMLNADGLLVLQGASCNHQIPAKLYEYIRAKRPVLALTDRVGDTAQLLRACGIDTIARLDDTAGIKQIVVDFLDRVRSGRAPIARAETIAAFSRRAQTAVLANLLEGLL